MSVFALYNGKNTLPKNRTDKGLVVMAVPFHFAPTELKKEETTSKAKSP